MIALKEKTVHIHNPILTFSSCTFLEAKTVKLAWLRRGDQKDQIQTLKCDVWLAD